MCYFNRYLTNNTAVPVKYTPGPKLPVLGRSSVAMVDQMQWLIGYNRVFAISQVPNYVGLANI